MKLFISYRRGDARDFAGRVADRLREESQINQVFFDVESIDVAEDFKTKIQKSIKQSGACLVLIGDEWLGKSASGGPSRIHDENDFVRLEVREALASKIKVIPILVNGAVMPAPSELPEDLRRLSTLNAVSVRHESFKRDMNFLADAILARKEPTPMDHYWNRHPFQEAMVRSGIGFAVAVVALIAGAAVHQNATGRALDQTLGGAGPVLVVVGAVLLAGLVLPLVFRPRRRRR